MEDAILPLQRKWELGVKGGRVRPPRSMQGTPTCQGSPQIPLGSWFGAGDQSTPFTLQMYWKPGEGDGDQLKDAEKIKELWILGGQGLPGPAPASSELLVGNYRPLQPSRPRRRA